MIRVDRIRIMWYSVFISKARNNAMTTKIESIRKKISALLRKNEESGAGETEANAAMTMAQKLMQEHGVTMEDIKTQERKSDDFSEKKINEGRKNLHEVDLYGITSAIATFTDTTAFKRKIRGQDASLVFFGYNADVELAEYIREVCKRAMETEWKQFVANNDLTGHKRAHRKNFMIGMSDRIAKRLRTLKESHTESTTGTELVVLKNQLVVQALNERNVNIRKNNRKVTYNDDDSFRSGQDAGDRVKFHKSVKDGTTTGPKMITA